MITLDHGITKGFLKYIFILTQCRFMALTPFLALSLHILIFFLKKYLLCLFFSSRAYWNLKFSLSLLKYFKITFEPYLYKILACTQVTELNRFKFISKLDGTSPSSSNTPLWILIQPQPFLPSILGHSKNII
jgi:hypothetical protein